MTRTYKQSSTGWEEYDYMRNIVEEKGFKFKEGVAEQLSPVPLRDGKPQQPRLMVVADPDGVRIFREYLRVDDQDDDGHTPLIGFVGYLEGQCPEMRRNVFNGGKQSYPGLPQECDGRYRFMYIYSDGRDKRYSLEEL